MSPRESTYRIGTLGCKANFYDSRRLAEALEALGWREAATGEAPDLCLLNTCAVTAGAARKSRQMAARMAREYPDSRVLVTGCYASACPAEVRATPGVCGVWGRRQWRELLQDIVGGALPPDGPRPWEGDFGISSFGGRTRAFLKVQEGCAAGCTYCILPRVRGRPRSRPIEDALAEARRLVSGGYPEIVLTGIHLGWYGLDRPGGPSLADLVRALAGLPGLGRLRLSSVEPMDVDDGLLEAMGHPAVCPHLHLALQSGDPEVLQRMGRPYSPQQFLEVVESAREKLDRPAITTDVMVGFPGETREAHERTLQLCRRAQFSRMHIFPFSARPGTVAATMPGRLPPKALKERSLRLRKLGRTMAEQWARSFIGTEVRVVFERWRDGLLSGYSERYVPVLSYGGPEALGRISAVTVTAAEGAKLRAEL